MDRESDLNRNLILVKNLYDDYFFQADLVQLLKLIIYSPFGLILVITRIFLLLLVNLILNIWPTLRHSKLIIGVSCAALGLRVKNETNTEPNDNKFKVYISNHVSKFDYLAIKSIVSNSNYFEHKKKKILSNFFYKILQVNEPKENSELYTNKAFFPLIFFPEGESTNGRYGILKFDPKPFDIISEGFKQSPIQVVPVCIKVERNFLPFSVNYIYSGDLTNILINLFLPYTEYNVSFLNEEVKNLNESIEGFGERVRTSIRNKMGVRSCDLTAENLKAIKREIERINQDEAFKSEPVMQQPQTMSFADISPLALRIKDILPEVSFETIRHHITQSSSLDIDTIIAMILDSNELDGTQPSTSNQSISRSMSVPVEMIERTSSTSSNSKAYNRASSMSAIKSFEERKFLLLNDARQRYLAKNQKLL